MISLIGTIAHKGWLFLANLSMEKKMIVIFVFLLSVPITYVSYMSARSTFNSVLHNATVNAEQMTTNASDTIDRYVADLKRTTALPLYNNDVQYYLEQQTTDWGKNASIGIFLKYLSHTKKEITSVYLVDKFDSIFYDKYPGIYEVSTEEQLPNWKRLVSNAGPLPVLQGKHSIRVNSNKQKEVFSVLRTIKSTNTLENIGMIVFDIDIGLFKGILDPVNTVTMGSSMIVDDQGKLIFASGNTDATQPQQQALLLANAGESSGNFESNIEGKPYLTVYNVSKQTGWTTSVCIPLSKILFTVKQNRNTLIITTLVILTFAMFVATLFSHALTRPLKSMVRLMKQVQHGNLDVWIHSKYNDEIGMLSSHFNRMILRIKDLLTEVTLTEKRKQKADMKALQSQINPHFIYNTLESIRMLAESNDDPRVAKLTYLLGLQLRYSIVRSEEAVTIQQELDHVRNYFDLLQIRFPDKFRLDIDTPDSLLRLPVLKLIFQPIVENSIFHGLERKAGLGTVTISAWIEDGKAAFCIADDGVGMDGDTLRTLNNSLKNLATGGGFGIGLHNVNERIRLHYGSEFGLQVQSELGKGTRVTFRIEESDWIDINQ
jgi:two-component system sensor histidine kinase YesM